MKLDLRTPTVADTDIVVGLSVAIDPERREDPELWRSQPEHSRLWIATESGRVVGYGCARPDPAYPPDSGEYRLSLGVEPAFRGQGAGTRLLEQLLDDLKAMGAHTARVRVQDSDPGSIAYFERRGFREYQRMLKLTQDLSSLPPRPTFDLGSVEIVTLASELERYGEACLPAIHEMQNACFADVPTGEPFIPPTLEFFHKRVRDPRVLHQCFFLAKDGGAYVGISYASPSEDWLGQWFTGVIPAYRGRGLARALKWRITEYGLAHGFREVRTSTLQANLPMKKANEALGFQVRRAEVRLQKAL